MRAALEHLPSEQSQVIELAYFGGFTHTEIADDAGDAGRHREGPDAARAGEDAPRAGRRAGEPRMTAGPDHERWADAVGAYLLGALPPDEPERLRGAPRRAARCAARDVERAARRRRRAADVGAARRAAAGAQGPDHGRRRLRGGAARRGRPAADAPPPRPGAPRRERRGAWRGWLLAARASRSRVRSSCSSPAAWPACCSPAAARTRAPSRRRRAAGADVRARDRRRRRHARRARLAPAAARAHLPGVAQAAGRIRSRPRSCGRSRADGSAEVAVPGSLDGVEAVLVTDEPQGGSDAPTSARDHRRR